MTKNKISRHGFWLPLLMLFMFGCDLLGKITSTKSGSSSGTTTQEQPAHEQATYNILGKSPFNGQQLNSTFWSTLEAYCKAGPTQLIIADMDLIPSQMTQAGFSAPVNQQYYALASTYAGMNWSPGDDTSQALWDARDQMDAWWSRYIQRIVQIMKNAPKTTAIIIINDGEDRLGSRLGNETYKNMSSVVDRVQLGDVM